MLDTVDTIVFDILGTLVDDTAGLRTAIADLVPDADDGRVAALLSVWTGRIGAEHRRIVAGERRYVTGEVLDREAARDVADAAGLTGPYLSEDLNKVRSKVGAQDRQILDEQAGLVRDMETEIRAAANNKNMPHAVPAPEPGIKQENDKMPLLSKLQIDMLINSFAADFTRVATLQYTNSVGESHHTWLGISEGQHDLSHKPDSDADAQDKLTRINKWYCEQLAYLAKRLAETPEPGGHGTLLDNTLIVWTNELGQGNTHSLDNIPWVLVGNGLDFKMGRSLKYPKVAHNRLLLSLAQGFGHTLPKFGNPNFCGDGPLNNLT